MINAALTGFNPSQLPPGINLNPQGLPKPASQRHLDAGNMPVSFHDTLTRGLALQPTEATSAAEGTNLIRNFVQAVDAQEKTAAEMRTAFLAGESNNLHQTVIASQEASISFSLMVELRNKVLESYQELMRIQL